MIRYPLGILDKKKNIQYKNRGMSLESMLNLTNEFYLKNNIAVIYKKPTPIKVVKTDKDNPNKILLAYFSKHSTTDYNGIYNGLYIDFEAKSTSSKTSLPLKNFQNCQLEHFERIIKQKAIPFVIIEFTKLNKYYLLLAKELLKFIKNQKRASLPLTYIEKNGKEIHQKIEPKLDYLETLKAFL